MWDLSGGNLQDPPSLPVPGVTPACSPVPLGGCWGSAQGGLVPVQSSCTGLGWAEGREMGLLTGGNGWE